MPTYEYQCKKCGHLFEKFQSIKDKPIRNCPQCRGGVQRLIGKGAGIIFKGTGFYTTDYRSQNYKESAKKEKDSKSSGSPSTAKSTSSPASKPKKAD